VGDYRYFLEQHIVILKQIFEKVAEFIYFVLFHSLKGNPLKTTLMMAMPDTFCLYSSFFIETEHP